MYHFSLARATEGQASRVQPGMTLEMIRRETAPYARKHVIAACPVAGLCRAGGRIVNRTESRKVREIADRRCFFRAMLALEPCSLLACEQRPGAPAAGGPLGHCSQASRLNYRRLVPS